MQTFVDVDKEEQVKPAYSKAKKRERKRCKGTCRVRKQGGREAKGKNEMKIEATADGKG
jgi:hypothetical protein